MRVVTPNEGSDEGSKPRSLLPVIGIPLAAGTLGGLDALLSTVQMPPGVPVATVGVGGHGAVNAALLAARIQARRPGSSRAAGRAPRG
ncbi:MAG: AIR carboxylase family protein, partial [bacterium]|nr:AIR carboxylase family protein [bacterium]